MTANTCRIDQPEKNTIDIDHLFDGVARGAWNGRDDRAVGARQGIDQARLSGSWGTGEDHPHTAATQLGKALEDAGLEVEVQELNGQGGAYFRTI